MPIFFFKVGGKEGPGTNEEDYTPTIHLLANTAIMASSLSPLS
jgi:hypothetical protein